MVNMEDHVRIIAGHLDKLVDLINFSGTILWECLISKEVISLEDANYIKQRYQADRDQARALLTRICKDSRQQFDKLVEALRATGQMRAVSLLQGSGPQVSQVNHSIPSEEVAAVQEKLQEYYKNDYSDVDMFTVHNDGHWVKVEDIYVPIRTATYHNSPDLKRKIPLKHYQELFIHCQKKNCRLIVVKAEPLGGKSTFVKKVCYDWAQSFNGSNDLDIFQQFKLVLPIILRIVEPGKNIMQVLKSQLYCLTSQDVIVIERLLQSEPDKVLFLLDGLDESVISNSEEVFHIMIGSEYYKSYVVITTRAEGMANLHAKGLHRPKRMLEAELEGFSDEHVHLYIKKYFEGRQNSQYQELAKLIFLGKSNLWHQVQIKQEELSLPKELHEMSTNPGRLEILCLLWSHNKKFSNGRVELFNDLVCVLLKLAEKKAENTISVPWEKLIINHKDILCNFGKLANKRTKGIMRTVFTVQEVEATVGKEAMKYGFLYCSNPKSGMQEPQVCFIHKTIQEWLAAFYMANNEQALRQCIYSSTEELLQDSSFHLFLLSFCKDDKRSCHYIFENWLPHLSSFFQGNIRDVHQWLKTNSKYFLQVLVSKSSVEVKNKLSPQINQGKPYHSCLGLVLGMSKHLKYVTLYNVIHNADELTTFVHAVGDVELPTQQLQVEMDCYYGFHMGYHPCKLTGGGQTLAELLYKMPHLTQLDLSWCGLASRDLQAMLPAIKRCVHIRYLDISGNQFAQGGQAAGELLLCLSSSSTQEQHGGHLEMLDSSSSTQEKDGCHLKMLNISNCELTVCDLLAMMTVTKGKPIDIKQLNVSGNRFDEKLLFCLSSSYNTEQHSHVIDTIDMSYFQLTENDRAPIWHHKFTLKDQAPMSTCKLTVNDLQALVAIIKDRHVYIKELNLLYSNFASGGQAAGKLLLCLSSSSSQEEHGPHVDTLIMAGCRLTVGDLEVMIAAIRGSQVTIKKLDLSENSFTGGGAAVGELLLQLASCEEHGYYAGTLRMAGCRLTKNDLEVMVAAIRGSQVTIKKLDLSKNSFRGGGAAVLELLLQLASHEEHGYHAGTLRMAGCELTKNDLEVMVAAIRERQVPIKQLDLSENNFAGGGAAIGELLLQLAGCEKLILNKCSLTASDLRAADAAIQGAQVHTDRLCLWLNEIPYGDKADITRLLPFATFHWS